MILASSLNQLVLVPSLSVVNAVMTENRNTIATIYTNIPAKTPSVSGLSLIITAERDDDKKSFIRRQLQNIADCIYSFPPEMYAVCNPSTMLVYIY